MRISDWSSDVCSSDLAGDAHCDADIGRLERGRVVDAIAGHRHGHTIALQGLDDAQLVLGIDTRVHREDRKSAVEGKSVSVRVDLGGRRIIKKKKQTRDNQRNKVKRT